LVGVRLPKPLQPLLVNVGKAESVAFGAPLTFL
jgi:hypothetical protein